MNRVQSISSREDSISVLAPGEIRIHLLRTRSGFPSTALASFLTAREISRLKGIGPEERRREFLWSRLLLKGILARTLGRKMGDLEFHLGSRGKPRVKGKGLHFNLSHARGLVALSLGKVPVGIDVEARAGGPKTVERMELIARRFFPRREREYLSSIPKRSRLPAFLRIFTLREAWAKAKGKGLGSFLTGRSFPATGVPVFRSGVWEFLTRRLEKGGIRLSHAGRVGRGSPLRYRFIHWTQGGLEDFLNRPDYGS